MTGQLTLKLDVPTVPKVPQPRGLLVVRLGVVLYLLDPQLVGGNPERLRRVFGWYYGYPACCVEAHVERGERSVAAHRERLENLAAGGDPGPRPETERRPLHPVSGHVLCPSCAAGPPAPLPPRPAELYGFAFPTHHGLDLEAPSTYEPPLESWGS